MIFAMMCRDTPVADKRRALAEKVSRRLDELGLRSTYLAATK